MRFGSADVEATVIEHRGPLGVGGRQLVRVRFELSDTGEPLETEVPVTELAPAA